MSTLNRYQPSFSLLRGLIAVTIMITNTLICFLPLVLVSALRVLPMRSWQTLCTRLACSIATFWISVNSWALSITEADHWNVDVPENLSPDKWYFVTANHQSWADILIAQRILNRKVPMLKFFLKRELFWVPVLGICWWALDFPFMRRYSREYLAKHPHKQGKDLAETRKACEKFQYTPTAVFNFMEGTRFTEQKYQLKQSQFQHLLPPKAGGAGFVLGAMGNTLDTLLDISIHYPHGRPTFWDFLCGKAGAVEVSVRSVSIPDHVRGGDYQNDARYKGDVQEWVNNVWHEKDQLLTTLKTSKD
ncbi:acyltransferase [Umboniibacter marinipuniceus]|uniref:1-acyl-sn-glycerol-3-phosphate acyltransferase n=1 Tax=Umboniibacter marinipuniceus TaxID=569599 RepID=A0A3M0A4R1_9GAMM|nr:acyltransferase [Umboniibacter marinipuniceus]RMA79374.1 1-acyl-sn-glycerol-3-phosphate acyltransferase [Umboniibacter marinipuniceus]